MNKDRCHGCRDDFYNGKNEYGVTECWHLKTAKLGKYLLIHINQRPPYNAKDDLLELPSCYRMSRFVKVKPGALDSKGYWKS